MENAIEAALASGMSDEGDGGGCTNSKRNNRTLKDSKSISRVPGVSVAVELDNLRDDPRFHDLLRRLNLMPCVAGRIVPSRYRVSI